MKKALEIFVTHILLQLLEIIASNKAAEVLIAEQHIDLWVTFGLPNSCVHAIQFVFGKSFSNRT